VTHTTVRRPALRVSLDGARNTRQDTLAVEEPLEIRLDGAPFTTTMRTPGHDLELALGFLVAEGVIRAAHDVVHAEHCPTASLDAGGAPTHNVVNVDLAPHVARPQPARHRHVTSACGICGTASVDAVRTHAPPLPAAEPARLDPVVLAALPDTMRAAQRVFQRTGGLHAAALFDAAGTLVCLREDVGRHNALDKVVGWAFERELLPLHDHIVQVSGRASFELVQKTWLAGCPVLAAVSAPSSLAVQLAHEAGLTLVGFSRGDHFTVYAGAQRLAAVG